MTLSELSISRPVLSTVSVLIIVLLGIVGFTYLGVREYPNVDSPVISVTVTYPGANPEVIKNQITEPLERSINATSGIRSLTSVSGQGFSRITVEFELGVDMERAANDVRDKVSRAQRSLPRDADPPTVVKADADADPIIQIVISSEKRSLLELSEIADLTFREQLQTIQNVSSVEIWGENRHSMRLWFDPQRMAIYGITPMDIRAAVNRENVELPAGSIEGDQIALSIRTLGLLLTPEDFNNIIIKEDDFRIVRFRDVGFAEIATENRQVLTMLNGVPCVSVAIIPQPGANQIEISDAVQARLEQIMRDLPDDIEIHTVFDNTQFVRAAISDVTTTVYIAFLLVVAIIFLFLRDWRVTLIPALVIPVALIGSFFIMYVAGFSINVLTMLAMVLAVGLVVDDAIVVSENIYQKIEKGMPPREAGIQGSREIFFAVISTTITLVAVFFPIIFLSGMTGRLFREFSIVVSGAVIISSFVALTFTPMLSTKILKKRERHNWLYRKTEPFFLIISTIYSRSLYYFLSRKFLAIPIVIAAAISAIVLWLNIPSEMAPLEDRSQIAIRTSAQEGATFEFVRDFAEIISDIADSVAYERSSNLTIIRGSWALIRMKLPDIADRRRSQMEIADSLTAAVRNETMARAFVQQQQTFGGRRIGMPIQYVLQAQSMEKLEEYIPIFMERVNESPVFQMADVNLRFTRPEIEITINRDKASLLGVSTLAISQTLQYALSGQRLGYFYMHGQQFQIIGEINRQQRNTPLDLMSIFVRSNNGAMIQLGNLVELQETVAPPQLFRYNRFSSATVSASLSPGYTLGQGLDEMDRIAKEVLDDTFRTTLTGQSREFRESSASLLFAFVLALLLIFLVLAAQFESFKDPLVIMCTVPLAIAGALFFMWLTGVTMNIFSQIGIIMLIGLITKNGILIVEFANQKQAAGISKFASIVEAAIQRFRPILMTSLSTIFGLMPLVLATGEGANGRMAMGIAVVGGMFISTFLTLYIIPAAYLYISTNREKRKAKEVSE